MNGSRLEVCKWYRVKRTVFYCTWYQVDIKSGNIEAEGIAPESYAAYITHQFIGESIAPYRTVADIAGISMPPTIHIKFTDRATITWLDEGEVSI